MATDKGHEALNAYRSEIQKIVSCITVEVCYCYENTRGRQSLQWSSGGFFRVTCIDNTHLYVDINQEVDIPQDEESRVTTKYYLYSIADSEKNDLIGFHYHPELTEDPVLYPHIHAYAKDDKRYLALNLHRKHIPSGRVTLEDVIHWLIEELKVKPLRKDWEQVLADAKEHFKEIRTWA